MRRKVPGGPRSKAKTAAATLPLRPTVRSAWRRPLPLRSWGAVSPRWKLMADGSYHVDFSCANADGISRSILSFHLRCYLCEVKVASPYRGRPSRRSVGGLHSAAFVAKPFGGEIARLLRREVGKTWAGRSIHEISKRDVVEVVAAIEQRGAPVAANKPPWSRRFGDNRY